MANMYKTFQNNDIVSTRTMLHEAIPITGTIISGTYDTGGTPENVKNYSHKMYQSVYDYPYLSSSANHILDITAGIASGSSGLADGTGRTVGFMKFLSKSDPGGTTLAAWETGYGGGGSSLDKQKKKTNTYYEMAQLLSGYNQDGSIKYFDPDGDFTDTSFSSIKMNAAIYINFSRLLVKDEIKKGSFSISFVTGGKSNAHTGAPLIISDTNGASQYYTNSPAGEYGILSCSQVSTDAAISTTPGTYGRGHGVGDALGLIYYQAGIIVLTSSVFVAEKSAADTGFPGESFRRGYDALGTSGMSAFAPNEGIEGHAWGQGTGSLVDTFYSGSQKDIANAVRNRIHNIEFNNTTELNSTIYFCRANHNDFNYSANPTYTSGSKIRVKNNTLDNPVTYITTIGLYSADNELLAVAKLSEPIKKDPTTELTFRVRLDY